MKWAVVADTLEQASIRIEEDAARLEARAATETERIANLETLLRLHIVSDVCLVLSEALKAGTAND